MTPEEKDECPKCKADLRGEPIPEHDREYFGNNTHFSRRIGLYSRDLDRTTHYLCPDCNHRWERT